MDQADRNSKEYSFQSGGDASQLDNQSNLGLNTSLMPGDATSRGMPDQPTRRSQLRRPPPNPAHFSPENPLGTPHGPTPNYPPSSQYGQRSGFFGQYTMSPQPPMGMPPSNPSYAYPHGYQSVPDNSIMSQNIHATYHSMIPAGAPVYPYQRHTSENNSSGFSSQPMFQSSTSPSPPMSSSSGSQNSTPPYPNPGQFHSLRYPSSISPSQYPYSHAPYSPTPVYQSPQYAPAPYPQHYSSPPEVDSQGTWWYLPHAAPNAPSYPGHYPMNYSPVHQEMENAYPASPMAPAPPNYLASPVRSPSLLSPGRRPTSSSLGESPDDSPAPPSPIPASSSSKPTAEKSIPQVRRSYHPNPPSHRSEWVMWAGNVPADATHDELWRFFKQDEDEPSGVVSIFLINRSNCAFVNYETEADLHAAISKFNGVPLRSHDPRCPRLVCRVRKIDDDLKAGVGGQRGVGMHTKWVREREKARGKRKATDQSDQSDLDESSSSVAALSSSVSSDDERPRFKASHSGSSGSYASTNSSLLTRHFPKRYFILKSLSQYDLDLSVQKNLWATQKHNEGILDQAYRTSKEVYLIFGVNKSGEFYGYARMAGPVRQGEQRVSWATRTDSSASSRSSLSPVASRAPVSDTIFEEAISPGNPSTSPPPQNYFSEREHRLVEASPAPVTPAHKDTDPQSSLEYRLPSVIKDASVVSAPAELGTQHHKITMSTPSEKLSLDGFPERRFQSTMDPPASRTQFYDPTPENFDLDETAPARAMRSENSGNRVDEDFSRLRLKSVEEVEERPEEPEKFLDDKSDAWGESFKVEWVCTERLPFYRTRHLRNPWNHDREVKVSRDGTELEPLVGELLLKEWEKLLEEGKQQQAQTQPAVPGAGATGKPSAVKRSSKLAPMSSGVKGDRETGSPISRS
ncbi:hypothetical protein GYMLUDRAFT_34236 [Collybiopsis luxurians FD-317 M1]|nr:hypothetical protein GYMLUDRAFT_34236 [Collybiopsis luxurians FD-317 M1]